jgi:polyisoprenoid-binding protein YceI
MWKVDETHSSLQFAVRHLAISNVRGTFRRWTANLVLEEGDLTKSSVSVEIESASVDSANAQRDANLRSNSFLDVEAFPRLSFESRRVDPVGGDRYRVVGDLTIRGVTREATLDAVIGGFVRDHRGFRRVGLSAATKIKRADFGMVWNQVLEAGGLAIGEEVAISIELEAIAQGHQQAAA